MADPGDLLARQATVVEYLSGLLTGVQTGRRGLLSDPADAQWLSALRHGGPHSEVGFTVSCDRAHSEHQRAEAEGGHLDCRAFLLGLSDLAVVWDQRRMAAYCPPQMAAPVPDQVTDAAFESARDGFRRLNSTPPVT